MILCWRLKKYEIQKKTQEGKIHGEGGHRKSSHPRSSLQPHQVSEIFVDIGNSNKFQEINKWKSFPNLEEHF